MDPIESPKGTYRNGPPGRRPDKCPQCGCVLEHFQAPAAPAVTQKAATEQKTPPLASSQPSVVPIDLFASKPAGSQESPQEPEKAAPTSPPLVDAEVGDLVIDEPAFARATETQISKAKAKRAVPASEVKPTAPLLHPNRDELQVLDNPKIDGKVTICALLYGDHHALHRRCLTSIVDTVPPSRMDLRVATNQVCLDTKNYLNSLPISKVYDNTQVRRKYGAMREMFHDPTNPINTEWIIWFDDDSYARKPNWLIRLGQAIVENTDPDVAMFGVKMLHPLRNIRPGKDPRRWFKNGTWWRDCHFRTKQGRDAPNGNTIHFIVGGFWALRTSVMRTCDIPDVRLNHNGGDICIGEQLHQLGYKTKLFNDKKSLIHTSASPRRGFHEVFPWER